MRFDASRSSEPNDCVNAFARSLQPSRRMASRISLLGGAHAVDAVGGAEPLGQRGRPIERDPAHQLRVHEVAGLAPDLPDALVLFLPAPGGRVGERDEEPPGARRELGRRSHWSGSASGPTRRATGSKSRSDSRCTALSSSP